MSSAKGRFWNGKACAHPEWTAPTPQPELRVPRSYTRDTLKPEQHEANLDQQARGLERQHLVADRKIRGPEGHTRSWRRNEIPIQDHSH